jgi:hypothetical protein
MKQWAEAAPQRKLQFTTLSKYLDAILPGVNSGCIPIPTFRGGTAYDYDAFWIENPKIKTLYRRNEHALQAAEMLAAISNLHSTYKYPIKPTDCFILLTRFQLPQLLAHPASRLHCR